MTETIGTRVITEATKAKTFSPYLYHLAASEISRATRYFDQVLQWKPLSGDTGYVLSQIENANRTQIPETEPFPDLTAEKTKRTAIILNTNVNHNFDIQGLLTELRSKLARTSRLICIAFNPYHGLLYRFANFLSIRSGELPLTFITRTDLSNIARLSGFEVVRLRPVGFFPWRCLGLGHFLNWLLPAIPFLRWFSFIDIITLRPILSEGGIRPSLSIVIPVRNEKGNIENALKRIADLKTNVEIVFVEGHSQDGTWEEIQRIIPRYITRFSSILAFQQEGKGKADAVRLGFSKAHGELFTILDGDLTMPPELLGRFYDAYCSGHADFINGTRLVYPMEGQAMRFLNRLGNIFFAKALSAVLDTPLGDSLCGTKLLTRHDYQRMVQWRKDFGEFDPFGDFELLFPASILCLGIADIPIRYRARTYGATNINRFRNGFELLRMTWIGLWKIRTGA